jgi:D-alanyl-lipoteichoic acid acyltransferase DltB (MBOAT superfamily)
MLFNSFSFLLFFLPAMLLGFFVLARVQHRYAAGWLTLGSLFFYGWWDVRYLPLLIGSILFNYVVGTAIARAQGAGTRLRGRRLMLLGIVIDLALLAYFKYCNFFVDNLEWLTASEISNLQVILPIGISFFTFTQIAFLVDTYRREVQEYDLVHYGLFVTYFPHLIAGPVLHHKEMMPQFRSPAPYRLSSENLVLGLTIFSFGMFKKVLIADNLAVYVKPVFDAQQAGGLNLIDAWSASLAYCLQIYFDFSGYSDMAIGLSRLFGIQLPLNFNSPYQALNISEFWRRWHMTLSRFLRDYLYIPLGGNRHGTLRRYVNLALTMVLGGLWHGAGWTYVIWGGLHGLYLVIHQAWQQVRPKRRTPAGPAVRAACVLLTFTAVVLAWVFFRAPSAGRAMEIVQAMLGGAGLTLPEAWHAALTATLGSNGFLHSGEVVALQGHRVLFITAGLLWVWFAPNTQQVMSRFSPALDVAPNPQRHVWEWQPNALWALASALLLTAALLNLTQISDFLYFQF